MTWKHPNILRKRDHIKYLKQTEVSLNNYDKPILAISSSAKKRRLKKPTNECSGDKTNQRRWAETLSVCEAIHGGSEQNLVPTVTGMVGTLWQQR